MTRLMERVDSAATRGAKKEALQARSSSIKVSESGGQSKQTISVSHGAKAGEITIRGPKGR
jgi:hypothetical protein